MSSLDGNKISFVEKLQEMYRDLTGKNDYLKDQSYDEQSVLERVQSFFEGAFNRIQALFTNDKSASQSSGMEMTSTQPQNEHVDAQPQAQSEGVVRQVKQLLQQSEHVDAQPQAQSEGVVRQVKQLLGVDVGYDAGIKDNGPKESVFGDDFFSDYADPSYHGYDEGGQVSVVNKLTGGMEIHNIDNVGHLDPNNYECYDDDVCHLIGADLRNAPLPGSDQFQTGPSAVMDTGPANSASGRQHDMAHDDGENCPSSP